MAIIYTYPQTQALQDNDLFVISQMDAEPGSTIRQTRSISAAKLADYIIPLVPGGGGGGPFLPLVAGPTTPLTGDLYMDPDGTSAGSGSHAIVFSGIDDIGSQLVGGEIFTQDSTIAPSGQDLVFNNADDAGVLQTNLFIDAFGQVGVGTTTPSANLDIATNLNVGTSMTVGTNATIGANVTFSSYGGGANIGTATYSLAVTAGGFVIEEPLTSGTVTGTGTTDYFVKFIDGPNGVIGDVPNVLEQAGEVIFQTDVRFDDVVLFDGGTVSSFQNVEMLDGAAVKFVDTSGPTTDAQLSSVAGSGKLNVDGSLQFDDYGSGTITGTAAYSLSVDASGNVIETAAGAGGVTGSGSSGDVTFWDGATSITGDSTTPFVYAAAGGGGQPAGRLGLGTSSPNFKMDISGGDLRFENNNGIRFGGTGSNNTYWRIFTTGSSTGNLSIGNSASTPYLTISRGVSNVGQVTFNQYGSGTYTGTAAYNLSIDASGNIIETATGGGGGGIGGSGTTNKLALFTSANTIGDSMLIQNAGATRLSIAGETLELGDGTANTVDFLINTTGAAGDVVEIQSQGQQIIYHEKGTSLDIGTNNDIVIDDSGIGGVSLTQPTTFLSDIIDVNNVTGNAGQVLTSLGGAGAGVEWQNAGGSSGYKSVQVFQWPNGSPAAYANWPNAGGALLPFNATPLVETGTYSGTAANFAWTCAAVIDPANPVGQYSQFTLGSNGAGTWRISTCQHWFDQLNNVNINVVFNLTSGGVSTPIGVINEKSADGATTNKIFYGELIREFAATDKLEVDVTFSNGGIPGPFPSANDNRPISITFEKLV